MKSKAIAIGQRLNGCFANEPIRVCRLIESTRPFKLERDIKNIKDTVAIGISPSDLSQRRIRRDQAVVCSLQDRTSRHDARFLLEIGIGVQIDRVGILRVVISSSLRIVAAARVLVASPKNVTGFVRKRGSRSRRRNDFVQSSGESKRAAKRTPRRKTSVSIVNRVHYENRKGPVRAKLLTLGIVKRADIVIQNAA